MAILTESKELKFNQDCHDHPIYLTWLNGVGGYDYWLFSKQHNPDTWEVEGAQWVRVIVKTGSLLVLNTKSERLTIKMNLDLPYINKQIE